MRLRKGQTAPGIKRKSEHGAASVRARLTALKGFLQAGTLPDGFDAYATQGKLAEWDDASRGIDKVSIYKLKKDRNVYEDLCEACDACKALADKVAAKQPTSLRAQKPAEDTKRGKDRSIKEKRDQIRVMTDELISMYMAYKDLERVHLTSKQLAENTRELIKEHKRRFEPFLIRSKKYIPDTP